MLGLNARAEDQRQQREQEQRLEGHHEMPSAIRLAPITDGAAVTEHAVGQKPPNIGVRLDEPRYRGVDLRGERWMSSGPKGIQRRV